MDFFSKGLEALRGDYHQPQTADETISKLCDRLASATLLEDRRASVLALKGLSREYKSDVGTKALPHLIEALKLEQMDVELTRAVLETIQNLCTPESTDNPPELAMVFTDEFIKETASVGAVLDTLHENDFYVRYTALQLLNTLLHNRAQRLQECVLVSAMGISRMMDVLDDPREVIRNEALLMLIALTDVNADIQKIVAFENAFERLLGIVMQEGGIQGGIVVQDCLQLIHNLLRYNVSNQNYFRETGGIQRAAALLNLPAEMPRDAWTEQMALNISMSIILLRILVGSTNANATVNQKMMLQCGVLISITRVAFTKDLPDLVRAEALYALGDMIRGSNANRDAFSQAIGGESANVTVYGAQMFAIAAVGQTGISDCRARMAAAYALECYLFKNDAGQEALGTALISSSSGAKDPVSSLLVNGVIEWEHSQQDPYVAWFSALVWSRVLAGSSALKQAALQMTFGDTEQGEEPVSFMHSITHALIMSVQDEMDVRVPIALLCLLSVWLYDSPASVSQFLGDGVNIQSLVEWTSQSTGMNAIIQGLAAFLLGIVHEFNDEATSPFPRASLHAILTGRIGLDLFISRITRLRETDTLQEAPRSLWIQMTSPSEETPAILFDPEFIAFFRENYDMVLHAATSDVSAPRSSRNRQQTSDSEMAAELKSLQTTAAEQRDTIASQQQQIDSLTGQLAESRSQVDAAKMATATAAETAASDSVQQIAALQAEMEQLRGKVETSEQRYSELEKEQEDLLVFLADQDEQVKKMRRRLRELGDDVPASDDDEGGDAQE